MKFAHPWKLCHMTREWFLVVYQMGRLCGGAHEISGIRAPISLHEWVGGGGGMGGGGWGWVGVGGG